MILSGAAELLNTLFKRFIRTPWHSFLHIQISGLTLSGGSKQFSKAEDLNLHPM